MDTIAFDCKLRRPGCVLIQAAMGTTTRDYVAKNFPSETWLITTTKDMKVYPVTDEQLKKLVAMAKEAMSEVPEASRRRSNGDSQRMGRRKSPSKE